jgi:hypothetical protein
MELLRFLIRLKVFLIYKLGFSISFSPLRLLESFISYTQCTHPPLQCINDRWIKTVLPKKTRSRTKEVKKREPAAGDVGTSTNYEEWIPQHHLKKEGTPVKKRRGGKASTPASPSD